MSRTYANCQFIQNIIFKFVNTVKNHEGNKDKRRGYL